MKREDIKETVADILVNILGVNVNEISDEGADLRNDLGMDSLDAIELIMEFEREFDISITDDDAETIQTIEDIINYLVKVVK